MAKRLLSEDDSRYEKIYGHLGKLKYRELQAEVIMRGMSFEDVIKGDHNSLGNFFAVHYDEPLKKSRLKEFELQMDRTLEERGYKKDDPMRRFKHFSGEEEEEVKKEPKPKVEKPKKEPRQKESEFGIYKGTKKALTFSLTKSLWESKAKEFDYDVKGLAKKFSNKMLQKVQAKFPEAQSKSVEIWMKRCLNQLCQEQKNQKK